MILRYWLSGYNILIFGVIGALIGYFLVDFSTALKPVGDIFIKFIRMIIIPIVIFSILSSTAKLSETNKAGAIGVFSLMYFLITSVVAVLLGIFIANFFDIGVGLSKLPEEFMNGNSIYENSDSAKIVGVWEFFLSIVPENPIRAFSEGNILQILVFTIFLGVSLSYVNNAYKDNFFKNVGLLNDGLLYMMSKIMILAPVGILALTAYAVGALGLDIIKLLMKFFVIYFLGCLFFVYVILGLLVHIFSDVSYIKFFRALIPLKIISFTTATSLVSLPTNIKNCGEMGLNKNVYNFVLPIGATINMNGNAMFYAMATIFCAQVFGIDLSTSAYIAIAITSIIGAVGTAGVPGPTLLIIAVLVAANVPLAAVPLLFAADRLFDMVRTTVNVIGDASCVAILDKYVKEKK